MRTTLTLNDQIAAALKRRAHESGKSFKTVVNEMLRAGLEASQALPVGRRFTVEPVALGKARPGIDLDKALRLAGELEDDALAQKLHLRK